MELRVHDIMSDDVVTIEAVQSVKNAARLMSKFGISGLVVLSDGNLVGILTERDILTRVVASGQDPQKKIVRDVMSEPVIVVNPAMPLENAVDIMFQEKIKKLPVVDKEGERLKLVGILSITDIARLQPKLLEGIKALGQINEAALEANAEFYIR